jgi:hypothetical protein
LEDESGLNQDSIYEYSEYRKEYMPRNLIYDFSDNIRPYFQSNEVQTIKDEQIKKYIIT